MTFEKFIYGLELFIHQSNLIEGIDRNPTTQEIDATRIFLAHDIVSLGTVCELQAAYAPGKPLRDRRGMDVRVGRYIVPRGGPEITVALVLICDRVSRSRPGVNDDPWREHCAFEVLHPFCDGNGRIGRAIWAWHMQKIGRDPFALPFLHRFYYQTLDHRM